MPRIGFAVERQRLLDRGLRATTPAAFVFGLDDILPAGLTAAERRFADRVRSRHARLRRTLAVRAEARRLAWTGLRPPAIAAELNRRGLATVSSRQVQRWLAGHRPDVARGPDGLAVGLVGRRRAGQLYVFRLRCRECGFPYFTLTTPWRLGWALWGQYLRQRDAGAPADVRLTVRCPERHECPLTEVDYLAAAVGDVRRWTAARRPDRRREILESAFQRRGRSEMPRALVRTGAHALEIVADLLSLPHVGGGEPAGPGVSPGGRIRIRVADLVAAIEADSGSNRPPRPERAS